MSCFDILSKNSYLAGGFGVNLEFSDIWPTTKENEPSSDFLLKRPIKAHRRPQEKHGLQFDVFWAKKRSEKGPKICLDLIKEQLPHNIIFVTEAISPIDAISPKAQKFLSHKTGVLGIVKDLDEQEKDTLVKIYDESMDLS